VIIEVPVVSKRNSLHRTRTHVIIKTTEKNIVGRETTTVNLAKRDNPIRMTDYNVIDQGLRSPREMSGFTATNRKPKLNKNTLKRAPSRGKVKIIRIKVPKNNYLVKQMIMPLHHVPQDRRTVKPGWVVKKTNQKFTPVKR
jgi:hypothetical protein